MSNSFVPLIGEIRRVSEKAILFIQPGRETWIPRSAIDDGDELVQTPRFDKYEINVAKWFAEKEGLE